MAVAQRKLVDRLNDGIAHYAAALDAISNHDVAEYEHQIIAAGGDVIGSLEWAFKTYLRESCRPRLSETDYQQLHRPQFDVLVRMLKVYAEPAIDPKALVAYEEYRRSIRNPGEHNALVPSAEVLEAAIDDTRAFVVAYLDIDSDILAATPCLAANHRRRDLMIEYLNAVASEYEYIDLRGLSPRIGGKTVRIRMEDVFVPVRGSENVSLVEHFGADLNPQEADRVITYEYEISSPFEVNIPWETVGDIVDGRGERLLDVQRLLEIPRLVILGDPGAGKTTLAHHLARTVIAQALASPSVGRSMIPVVIRVSDFGARLSANPGLSLYEYISKFHSSKFSEITIKAIRDGNALIIMDGLDEVPDPSIRVQSVRSVEKFVMEYARNRYIVTSRIIGYRQNQLSGDFRETRLVPFSPDQILAFLKKWHCAIESEKGDSAERDAVALWEAIQESPGTRKLASNPLLLTIIALANRQGTKLPSRRVELYLLATETLLENWPLRQRGQDFRAQDLLQILEPIAYEIIKSGTANAIGEHELRPLVQEKLCDVRGVRPSEAFALSASILNSIEEHTGFFIKRGFDEQTRAVYGFLHLTFAEYLAGRYLAETWAIQASDAFLHIAHDPRWREVMLLMAGHLGLWSPTHAAKLVSDILAMNSELESYLNRDLFLAAAMLADNTRVLRPVQDMIVHRLLNVLETSPVYLVRRHVADLISAIGRLVPIGEPVARILPKEADSPDVRIAKAILCIELNHETEVGVRTILDALCDEKVQGIVALSALNAIAGRPDGISKQDLAWLAFPNANSTLPTYLSEERTKLLWKIAPSGQYRGGLFSFQIVEEAKFDLANPERIVETMLQGDEVEVELGFYVMYGSDARVESNIVNLLLERLLEPSVSSETFLRCLNEFVQYIMISDGDPGVYSSHFRPLIRRAIDSDQGEVKMAALNAALFVAPTDSDTEEVFLNLSNVWVNWDKGELDRLIDIVCEHILLTPSWFEHHTLLQQYVGDLLLAALESPFPDVRRKAAQALLLSSLGEHAELAAIVNALDLGTWRRTEFSITLTALGRGIEFEENTIQGQHLKTNLRTYIQKTWHLVPGTDSQESELDRFHFGWAFLTQNGKTDTTKWLVDLTLELLTSADPIDQAKGALLIQRYQTVAPEITETFTRLPDNSPAVEILMLRLSGHNVQDGAIRSWIIHLLNSSSVSVSLAAASALQYVQDNGVREAVIARIVSWLEADATNVTALSLLASLKGASMAPTLESAPF